MSSADRPQDPGNEDDWDERIDQDEVQREVSGSGVA